MELHDLAPERPQLAGVFLRMARLHVREAERARARRRFPDGAPTERP